MSFLFNSPSKKSLTPEDISEDSLLLRDSIISFIEREIHPIIDKIDLHEDNQLMSKLLKKSSEMSMMGVNIPEKFGGIDLNFIDTLLFGEATACGYSFATAIGAHTSIGTLPIVYYGNENQKNKYLPKLNSGELIASYCLSEPESGSDANSAKTKALLSDDKKFYLISGQKMWITNGSFADLFIVFAKINDDKLLSAFIIEKKFGNITIGKEEKKMGIKGSSTVQIYFNNTKVPISNLLGKREEGFKIALNVLNSGRIKIGASAVGGLKYAIQRCIKYSKQRKQFNQFISDFGAIKHKIAEMVINTFAIESLVFRIGFNIESNYLKYLKQIKDPIKSKINSIRDYTIESSIAKVYGSELLCESLDESIQIFGGMGYAQETGVERGYRDARITKIYEGTNEINRLLIFGELSKKFFKTKEINIKKEVLKSFIKLFINIIKNKKNINIQISNMKNLFIILSTSLIKKYEMKLIEEQEIIMNLSDLMIQIYAIESSYMRVLNLKDKVKNYELHENLLKSINYKSVRKFKDHFLDIINTSNSKISKIIFKLTLNFFIKNLSYDIISLRRSITNESLKMESYPFLKNYIFK